MRRFIRQWLVIGCFSGLLFTVSACQTIPGGPYQSDAADSADHGVSRPVPNNAVTRTRGETTLQAVGSNNDSELTSEVDLDQQTDIKSAEADLRFTAEGGTMLFYALDPIGQAVAVPYGKSPPTHDNCLATVVSMSTSNMPEVEPGMYFCVKTNQNMLASVWVQSLDAESNRLSLGFHLWPE